MSSEQNDNQVPLRPYEADGIHELDNNLPNWWVGLFVFTTVFAVLYLLYMHLFGGASIQQEYEQSLKVTYNTSPSASGNSDEPTELNAMIGHENSIKKGKETYSANCAPCHGVSGEGTIGPNLTDKYWLHGGSPDKIFDTIQNGFPAKGMPAWGTIIGDTKCKQLAAYLTSLKGSNPPNAKAPQGDPEN
jgi:cytochrome c oxidase cbb3-type subunit 3